MVDSMLIDPRPDAGFVETHMVKDITQRALRYLQAGLPVHFRGPSGTGKTTLALHVAHLLKRPVVLVFGDDEFGSSYLSGGPFGYRKKVVVDNYIHSVLVTKEDVEQRWLDGRLVAACKHGYTFVYDEFTRSRPETNNALLSVLEEGIINLPTGGRGEKHFKVHPNFTAIFTSNPEEYAGVHKLQDALVDRLVTIDLYGYDRETEIEITAAKSGLELEDAARIVSTVHWIKEKAGYVPRKSSLRSAIMIAQILKAAGGMLDASSEVCREAVVDVLLSDEAGNGIRDLLLQSLEELWSD